jgi:hypothetical protein
MKYLSKMVCASRVSDTSYMRYCLSLLSHARYCVCVCVCVCVSWRLIYYYNHILKHKAVVWKKVTAYRLLGIIRCC